MSESKKRYWVIRISSDAKFVLVVHSVDGKPPAPLGTSVHGKGELTFLHCTYDSYPDFQECTFEAALQAFSGIADGMGCGELPTGSFNSMEEVIAWRTRAVLRARIAICTEMAENFAADEPQTAEEYRGIADQVRKELTELDAPK